MTTEHKPHSELVDLVRSGLNEGLYRASLSGPTDHEADWWNERQDALTGLVEQLEAAQRELQDATRLIAALVYRTNKTSGVLLYPTDFHETLTLSRYENPMANTVHLFASNPAMRPE